MLKNINTDQIVNFLRLFFAIILFLIALIKSPLTIVLFLLIFYLLGVDISLSKGIKITLGTMIKTIKD